MPVTGLNHPLTGAYPAPIEIPDWLIVLRDGKVTRNRDLKGLRAFVRGESRECGVTKAISGLLRLADEHLERTDVYILKNREGDELHFCRPEFQHKRSYIAHVAQTEGITKQGE